MSNVISDADGWMDVKPKGGKYVPPHLKAAVPSGTTVPTAVPSGTKYVVPGLRAPIVDNTPILGFAPGSAAAVPDGTPVPNKYVPPGQRLQQQPTQTFDEMFPIALSTAAFASPTVGPVGPGPAQWQAGNFIEFLKKKELEAQNEAPIDDSILASHTNVLTGKTIVVRDLVLDEEESDTSYVGPKNFYARQEVRLQQQAAARLQMMRQRYGFEDTDESSTSSVQESHGDDEQGDFYDNNSDSSEEEEVYSD